MLSPKGLSDLTLKAVENPILTANIFLTFKYGTVGGYKMVFTSFLAFF